MECLPGPHCQLSHSCVASGYASQYSLLLRYSILSWILISFSGLSSTLMISGGCGLSIRTPPSIIKVFVSSSVNGVFDVFFGLCS
jgi:hypothetical protein